MFQQKISTNWQPSALNSDVMLLLVTHTAHLFIQVLIYTNWLRCYLLWGGNNNNNNKQLLNNWEAAQCYREEGFDRKDGDWYCVFRASQLNLSQHITVPARTPSARQQTNRCSLPPFFLALSSVPTSQQWSLAHVKLPLTVQAVAGRTPNRQHPARGGGCQPGAARSFPPAGGRPRAAQSGGCRTLPRRAVARGTRRPSSQSGAFFHPRAVAARPGPARPCRRAANLTGAGCGLAVTSGPDVSPDHAPAGVRATPRSDNGESLFRCHRAMQGLGKPRRCRVTRSKIQH